MDLVAVDKPAGGSVADLGVVLPTIPQPADHFDEVDGLVEALGDQSLYFGRLVVLDPVHRLSAPTEMGCFGEPG